MGVFGEPLSVIKKRDGRPTTGKWVINGLKKKEILGVRWAEKQNKTRHLRVEYRFQTKDGEDTPL